MCWGNDESTCRFRKCFILPILYFSSLRLIKATMSSLELSNILHSFLSFIAYWYCKPKRENMRLETVFIYYIKLYYVNAKQPELKIRVHAALLFNIIDIFSRQQSNAGRPFTKCIFFFCFKYYAVHGN